MAGVVVVMVRGWKVSEMNVVGCDGERGLSGVVDGTCCEEDV